MQGCTRKFVIGKKFQMQKNPEKKVSLDGDALVVVEKFCYLRYVLSTDGRVHDSVVLGIRAGWNKFKKLSGIL